MNNEANLVDILIGFIAGLIISVLVGAVASTKSQESVHEEAVRQDVACYYLDENNEKQFAWKTNCPES